jgi:release factor glutamine methyltransferase
VRVDEVDFEGLRIRTDPGVLVPRGWTAAQAHWAAELASGATDGPILEVCAGAGHLGLLTARLTGRDLVAVDLNPVAGSLIQQNAEDAGVVVDVRIGDMASVLGPDEFFPVMVVDPPWVRSREVEHFPEDPVLAIDGGEDGLRLVRASVGVIAEHLAPQGVAIVQVGPDQGEEAAVIARAQGLAVQEVRGFPRGCLLHLVHGA